MLDALVVSRQLDEARRSLAAWSDSLSKGIASVTLANDIRHLNDVLTCLLDEANDHQHPTIHYLIDRCEELQKRTTR
jgi:hypothetical protein